MPDASGFISSADSDLWLRKWSLILTNRSGSIVEVTSETPGSDFRMTFQTQAADEHTPATAIITVYNLSDRTMKGLVKEFDKVGLEAGYIKGRYGIIFQGQVKQYARGHEENMTESYLRIFAADEDIAHRYGIVNTTLEAGADGNALLKAPQDGIALKGTQYGYQGRTMSIQKQYRGSVLFGLGVDELVDQKANYNMAWNIIDGKLVLTPKTGYQPGEIVLLNSQTGLIGHPEVTDNGISVTSLLNPAFRVKGLVQLNNNSINWTGGPGGNPIVDWPGWGTINTYDMLSDDGVYIILVRTHEGDTRGNPWYTHLTCIARDPSYTAPTQGGNLNLAKSF